MFHAGVDPYEHFQIFGWHEGRDPDALLDVSGYLAVNRDIAAAGANPLDQYHQSGWKEGRDPSGDFDTTLYLIHNPDVAAAGVDPLQHYLEFGKAEGRTAYQAVGNNIVSGFDAHTTSGFNPDVAAAGVDPLQHFQTFGWHEDAIQRMVRHRRLSVALRRRRGGGVIRSITTRRSDGIGPRPVSRLRYARLSGGKSGRRRSGRQSARSLPDLRRLRGPCDRERRHLALSASCIAARGKNRAAFRSATAIRPDRGRERDSAFG